MSSFVVPSGPPPRVGGSQWRPLLAASVAIVALLGAGLSATSAATAAPVVPLAAAAVPADGDTVSAESLPTPQIDGVVWEQVVVGDVVYVAGSFTSARPFGAKRGVNETPRANVLAYDLNSGALLPFAPVFNSTVYSLAASPDGTRLYAGGIFTSVNGETRYRIAAFDIPSGTLVPGFRPIVNQKIQALIATDDSVYAGGTFVSAAQRTGTTAVARSNAAAFAAADGAVLPWAPKVQEGRVLSMVISPAKDKIVLGGTFRALNGSNSPGWTMGAVNVTTGASLPWKVNATVPDRQDYVAKKYDYAVYGLSADDDFVYGSMGPASFEGTWQARWSDGSIGWLQDCHGDSYASYSDGDVVYTASHAHDCSNIGGFTDYVQPKGWYRALAMTREATQKVGWWDDGYRNYYGQPAPSVLNWYPDFNTGPTTGQGPWDITGAQGYVLVAGEFSKLNGTGQEGLARFAPRATAANKVGPSLSGTEMKPWIVSTGSSEALVRWGINFDQDDETLTYQVLRDGELVHEFDYDSLFWKWRAHGAKTGGALTAPGDRIETLSWTDAGLETGKTFSYTIRTVDPFGNATLSDPTSFTMSASGVERGIRTSYDRTVLDDQPDIYWPFNKVGGRGLDWAGATDIAVIADRADGVEPDANGRSYRLSNNTWSAALGATTPLNTYSSEMWFNTTTKTGGQLIGMASDRSTTSPFDRQVYMDNAGRIISANYDSTTTTNGTGIKSVSSTKSYNDGKWHHVVNTLSRDGLKLYVDGVLVGSRGDTFFAHAYSGAAYWNLGGHVLTGRPNAPTSNYFTGSIDNVGIYARALDAATVEAHYAAAAAALPTAAPKASFAVTRGTGLDATFDASSSTDADGRVTAFAWDFGDGSTATGVKPAHTYATSGHYTVKLTVRDDSGQSNTMSTSVGIAPSNATDYDRAVFDDKPTIYWPFNETSGNAIDWTRTTDFGPVAGRADGIESDPIGRSYNLASNMWGAAVKATASTTFSTELWFNTTTTTGGQLIGLAGERNLDSGFSRQVYMDNAGRIRVSNYDGALKDLTTTRSYNDGKWHHVVNTLGSDGLKLYVDGVLQASRTDSTTAWPYTGSGYWNLGAHSLAGRTAAPSSIYFTGRIDNVGIYDRVLDVATVKKHFDAGASATNAAPKASFVQTADGLTVATDATGSSDADGRIASYAWDFGDGTTGTGVTASHTYAKAGTYTVKLSVTDDSGATNARSSSVTVVDSRLLAQDAFTRPSATGTWGAAETGGAWTLSGGASGFSTDGTRAVIRNAAGTTRSASLPGISAASTESTVSFSIAEKSSASQFVSVTGRKVGADAYTARVVVQTSGVLQLQLQRSGTTLKTVNLTGVAYTVGQTVNVRFRVTGSGTTTLDARVWTTGEEPAAWQASATDTTAALQSAGSVGLGLYVGSGGSTSTVAFEQYRVTRTD